MLETDTKVNAYNILKGLLMHEMGYHSDRRYSTNTGEKQGCCSIYTRRNNVDQTYLGCCLLLLK